MFVMISEFLWPNEETKIMSQCSVVKNQVVNTGNLKIV